MQVLINGMTMAYEEHGAGPAVLLLHGFSADHPGWNSQIQRLTLEGYRVVVPELRGFGESSAPAGDNHMDVLSDHLVGLLNYLGIGRAAIVGLALGAPLLDSLLQRHPQRVAAAVSLDASQKPGSKDITSNLLDFFQGVKRFPLRCQTYRKVA